MYTELHINLCKNKFKKISKNLHTLFWTCYRKHSIFFVWPYSLLLFNHVLAVSLGYSTSLTGDANPN